MWTTEKTLNLIESLRQVPALWNVSCKEYRDRNKKMDEATRLAEEFSTTTEEIIKKIKSLKTQFRREHKKILDGNRSGAGTSSPCTWFGYEHLLFLIGNNESKGSRSTIIEEESIESENIVDDVESVNEEIIQSHPAKIQKRIYSEDAPTPSSTRLTQERKKAKALEDQRTEEAYTFMKNVKDQISSRDAYSVYADYIANRLRNCSQSIRAQNIAKHQIENILFNLEMGVFNENVYQNMPGNVESFNYAKSNTPASTVSIPQTSLNPFSPSQNPITYIHSSRSNTPASTVSIPQISPYPFSPSSNSISSPPEMSPTYVTQSTIDNSEKPVQKSDVIMTELGQFLLFPGPT